MTSPSLIYRSCSESMVMPRLIEIKKNLFMAAFDLMKLIPARFIIDKALQEGKINHRYPIVETSSGTFAFGIALICVERGLTFHVFSDSAIDDVQKNLLLNLKGKVEIVCTSNSSINPQNIRLENLKNFLNQNAECFWPNQYDNPDNQNSYEEFSNLLLNTLGKDFILVGPVGSGGSTCGTIKFLRKKNPEILLVGVDTFGSVLFGCKNSFRLLRGLGNSLMPKNLDHSSFDEIHWISASEAFKSTRNFYSKKGFYIGPTTGAAYQVANWIAQNNLHKKVVFISPDKGHRYQDTVYNDTWLKKHDILMDQNESKPKKISVPPTDEGNWSYMAWARRTYSAVMNI